ncbi:MAG: hypothetical protein GX639_16240 [Fibrobacter sp.]|nr:hypothetical protein [Fibrobacter sp.]
MSELLKQICSNGFALFIPIFLWNLIFLKKLPPVFENKTFDKNIPKYVLIGESIFRAIIFVIPILTEINFTKISESIGIYIFITGVIVYFLTWLFLIYYPDSKWSKSIIGFCAPAFTPIIWLVGFAFTVNKFNININYNIWFYLAPSIIFVFFHVVHSAIAFKNWNKNTNSLEITKCNEIVSIR